MNRGWIDIGYHWIIDQLGNIIQGRKEEVVGAHCYGHNANSIGICVLGLNTFTKESMNALTGLVSNKLKEYNLTLKNVYGHNSFTIFKTCPNYSVERFCEIIEDNLNREDFLSDKEEIEEAVEVLSDLRADIDLTSNFLQMELQIEREMEKERDKGPSNLTREQIIEKRNFKVRQKRKQVLEIVEEMGQKIEIIANVVDNERQEQKYLVDVQIKNGREIGYSGSGVKSYSPALADGRRGG